MDRNQIVIIDYTNWRGERSTRRIIPLSIQFENSEWHPDTQWILHAVDIEKGASREFAMQSIHEWRPLSLSELLADALGAPVPTPNTSVER